MREEIQEEFE